MSGDELTELLWRELGRAMRRAREDAGVSIRNAEVRSAYSRGMLSLAETGKARPSRELVRWYDATFAANGLLLSLYIEALTAALPSSERLIDGCTGDALRVVDADPSCGVIVAPGARVWVRWTLRNTGTTAWTARRLERLGAVGGSLVLGSVRRVPVADTAPGAEVSVACELAAPELGATYVCCWALVDGSSSRSSRDAVVFFAVVVE
ncbi:MAG TPA: NBR1-Ig-like domain-containing protein [Jatrophihabitans sp.]